MKRFDPLELHEHWAPYGWAVLLAIPVIIVVVAGAGLVVVRGFTGRVEAALVVVLLVGAAIAWCVWVIKPLTLAVAS